MSMEGGSPECEYLLRIARAAVLRSNPGTYAYGFATPEQTLFLPQVRPAQDALAPTAAASGA